MLEHHRKQQPHCMQAPTARAHCTRVVTPQTKLNMDDTGYIAQPPSMWGSPTRRALHGEALTDWRKAAAAAAASSASASAAAVRPPPHAANTTFEKAHDARAGEVDDRHTATSAASAAAVGGAAVPLRLVDEPAALAVRRAAVALIATTDDPEVTRLATNVIVSSDRFVAAARAVSGIACTVIDLHVALGSAQTNSCTRRPRARRHSHPATLSSASPLRSRCSRVSPTRPTCIH